MNCPRMPLKSATLLFRDKLLLTVAFILLQAIVAEAAVIAIDSPRDYQVFQRHLKDRGTIRLHGSIVAKSGELQVRVVQPATESAAERLIVDWQPIAVDFAQGVFHVEQNVPTGGWYRVELHLLDGGKILDAALVNHVGVGEVFVIAGQSNSTNYGSERQSTETGMVSSFDGSNWSVANDPQLGTQDGSKGGSFLPAFGDALYQRHHVPIGVASTGAGATSVRQWLPNGEQMTNLPTIETGVREVRPGVWESNGDLFTALSGRMNALGPRGFRAVLWHQGESDAGQARAGYPADRQISGKQYQDFMEKLVRASRKQAGWDVPWITAQATYHSEEDPADEEFRAAQRRLWQAGITHEGPDTDSLRKEYRDGVHFNSKGLRAHGKLWAEKVSAYLDTQFDR